MGIGLQIAGGFGKRLSEYMEEKEQFDWENKRAERKFGMTTGQLGVKKAEEKAGIVVDKVKYLQERGLDNNILRYAFDQEKIAGIDKLYNEVLEGSDQASGEQLNRLVNVSKDYAATDNRPWTEVVKEAMQIYATPENAAKHTDQQREQKGFWAAMLADPSTTSGYDDTQRYGGYTRADQDRIIMASATTPRGEGLLKIDRTARIKDLSITDFTRIKNGTDTNISNEIELTMDLITANASSIGDGSKSSPQLRQDFLNMQRNDDWIGITKLYGDNILQSLYDAESSFPGAILANPNISRGKKSWLKNKLNIESSENNQNNTDSLVKTSDIDYTEEFEKAKSSFPKGTDLNAPKFNSVAEVQAAIKDKTIKSTDAYFIYTPSGGWEYMNKIDLANFSPKDVNDADFLEWVNALPTSASDAAKELGINNYKGLLQGAFKKRGGFNIKRIKDVTKIVTANDGKEYTYKMWQSLPKNWTKNIAASYGLPFKWSDAEKTHEVKYNLSPYTYSGDE